MWGLFLSLLSWIGISPVPLMAGLIGTTEPALKLLISIIMGYPVAIVYHKFVKKHEQYRNLFFFLTGLDIAYYNFGISLYHNAIPAFVIYLTTMTLGPGKINVIITFIFNMGYLLAGYLMTESENYDITWTMPHCVLTLKLIALSFDLWDGQLKMEGQELSASNKKTALDKPPTFLELMGFVYFPACFLVGPIFSFRRYSDFITDKFPRDADIYENHAMSRLIQGILYLVAFQVGGKFMRYLKSFNNHDTFLLYINRVYYEKSQ